ncbi:MAG: OmpA family protein [Alphaproteobacteria bacterium]|nr:OmpA family protein [Alphaproteobacteria bacterium]
MKNKCYTSVLSLAVCVALGGCMGTDENTENVTVKYETPTVDYVENISADGAPHQDSFLNQLAMNYRSYALYNARTSGYPDVAELFAQKAVGAFSGETPFPENLDNWPIRGEAERFDIYTAYNDLIEELKNDAVEKQPQLAAEAQAKFDCWISAASTGQSATAEECRNRFAATMETLRDCSKGKVVAPTAVKSENLTPAKPAVDEQYYPETRRLSAMAGASRSRDGVLIVNNVNVPASVIQPIPVAVAAKQQQQPPMIFNQNIYGGEENVNEGSDTFNGSDDLSGSGDKYETTIYREQQECQKCKECQAQTSQDYQELKELLLRQQQEEPQSCSVCDDYQEIKDIILVQPETPTCKEFHELKELLLKRSEDSAKQPECSACQDLQEVREVLLYREDIENSRGASVYREEPKQECTACESCQALKEAVLEQQEEPKPTCSTQECPKQPACQECQECKAQVIRDNPTCPAQQLSVECPKCQECQKCQTSCPQFDDYVSRAEFIELMTDLRAELAAINSRLDDLNNAPAPVSNDKTIIKVQQIPLEPRQRIVEEIFEIRFDFDKAIIKPEYDDIIRKLAETTQSNKNVKVSVVGHTDTAGSNAYNYALGGRRAEAVQKMLIERGIPASQIIAVSAGEEDLKVPTPNNTPNAENRRVRVVKEVQYMEEPKPAPIVVEEYTETDECEDCGM